MREKYVNMFKNTITTIFLLNYLQIVDNHCDKNNR